MRDRGQVEFLMFIQRKYSYYLGFGSRILHWSGGLYAPDWVPNLNHSQENATPPTPLGVQALIHRHTHKTTIVVDGAGSMKLTPTGYWTSGHKYKLVGH